MSYLEKADSLFGSLVNNVAKGRGFTVIDQSTYCASLDNVSVDKIASHPLR